MAEPITPSPRQLLLKLLAVAPHGELDAASAVRAASLFGISANHTRVALARLQADSLIRTVARGAYALGEAGLALAEDIRRWRDAEQRLCPWDGGWVAVMTGPLGRRNRKALRSRERALALSGFHELEPGLSLRPDNMLGGVVSIRERLVSIGLDPEALVCRLDELDEKREAKARTLWRTGELQHTYQRQARLLKDSIRCLEEMDTKDAAREAYQLGDQTIRLLAFDPLLPEPLLDTHDRQQLNQLMQRYDDLGRIAWQRFLSETAPQRSP